MSSLPQTGHEHHERIREHVDRLPELAHLLAHRPTPADFGPRLTAELVFITSTLWPHVQIVEDKVYPQLERLMQNRHSMAPMKREHAELASLSSRWRATSNAFRRVRSTPPTRSSCVGSCSASTAS